jgi:hypothetical protein
MARRMLMARRIGLLSAPMMMMIHRQTTNSLFSKIKIIHDKYLLLSSGFHPFWNIGPVLSLKLFQIKNCI